MLPVSAMKLRLFFYRVLVIALAATSVALGAHAWTLRQKLAQQPAAAGPASGATEPGLLRQLLQERETAYFALKDEFDRFHRGATNPVAATLASAPATNRAEQGRGESWLERLRTEDPERYRRYQEEREQRRQQRVAELQQQFDRLDARLQAATTQTEADLVAEIANTLARLDELRQEWEKIRNLPDDQRRAAIDQLRADSIAAYEKLAELRQQDRVGQLQSLATQIGVTDTDAFLQQVQRIIEDTETRRSRSSGRRADNTGPATSTP